jgi:addiction module RelE/StbE family toxin
MTARLRWTAPANTDFLGIAEWIKAHNPLAAARVGRRILDAVEALADHPYRGRPGRVPGTRELVVTRFPYLIVYEVEADAGEPTIVVLRVLHGAMRWPPAERG